MRSLAEHPEESIPQASGSAIILRPWAQDALSRRLQQKDGFNSCGEICQWLESQLGFVGQYKTVHQFMHYRLKASAKGQFCLAGVICSAGVKVKSASSPASPFPHC